MNSCVSHTSHPHEVIICNFLRFRFHCCQFQHEWHFTSSHYIQLNQPNYIWMANFQQKRKKNHREKMTSTRAITRFLDVLLTFPLPWPYFPHSPFQIDHVRNQSSGLIATYKKISQLLFTPTTIHFQAPLRMICLHDIRWFHLTKIGILI